MMTLKSFLFVFSLLTALFFSCGEKRPENILSEDQMVTVLTDFYLKEAKINTLGLLPDSSTTVMRYYMNRYAAQNKLADSVLDKSYQYYLEQPEALSKIYDRVIDSLSLQEQRGHSRGVH